MITHGPRCELMFLLSCELDANVTLDAPNRSFDPIAADVSASKYSLNFAVTSLTSTPMGESTKTGTGGICFDWMNRCMYQRIVCVRPTANEGTSNRLRFWMHVCTASSSC